MGEAAKVGGEAPAAKIEPLLFDFAIATFPEAFAGIMEFVANKLLVCSPSAGTQFC
jgi:hypothetical protein